jgi:hypothetical protein
MSTISTVSSQLSTNSAASSIKSNQKENCFLLANHNHKNNSSKSLSNDSHASFFSTSCFLNKNHCNNNHNHNCNHVNNIHATNNSDLSKLKELNDKEISINHSNCDNREELNNLLENLKEHPSSIIKLSDKNDVELVKVFAFLVCREYLGGAWHNANFKHFKIERLS